MSRPESSAGSRASTGVRNERQPFVPALVLATLLLFSVALLARSAAQLPFWYDESLTVRLSKLGSLGELWAALTAGVEFTPPLIYLATKLTRMLPGSETLTARLPGLIGYVLLACGLFVFLKRRFGAWFALAAVALLPLAEYTVRYAIEARAYMLVLGVSAIALVSWQDTVERRSRFAPVGLAVAVACALLLHVWAILLPLALIVGELVDFVRTRAIRWRVVFALAAASPALAIYPILLRASKTVVFGGPAYAPSLDKLYAAFRLDVPRPRVLLAAAVVAVAAAGWARRRHRERAALSPSLSFPELAVMATLLVSPLVPYAYAASNDGAFMVRYAVFALPAAIYFTCAALTILGRGDDVAGRCAAAIVLAGVVLYFPPKVPLSGSQSALVESLAPVEPSLDPSIPFVIVNPVDVLAFDDQAPAALRSRAVFVADSALALAYTGTNGIDLGYERGEPYLGVQVRRTSYADLVRREKLYLVGKWQALSWLPQRLRDDGWTFTNIGGSPQAPIYLAAR